MNPLNVRDSFDFEHLEEHDPATMQEAMLTPEDLDDLYRVVDDLIPTPDGQEDGHLSPADARQLASMAFVAGRVYQISRGPDEDILLKLSPRTIQRFLDFLAEGDQL